jgi:hypothetical protein
VVFSAVAAIWLTPPPLPILLPSSPPLPLPSPSLDGTPIVYPPPPINLLSLLPASSVSSLSLPRLGSALLRVLRRGADRPSLDIPGVQLALLDAVLATGTPTVVILFHGRPVTFGTDCEWSSCSRPASHLWHRLVTPPPSPKSGESPFSPPPHLTPPPPAQTVAPRCLPSPAAPSTTAPRRSLRPGGRAARVAVRCWTCSQGR